MKVNKVKKIEGCLEGSAIRDILFDDKIDFEFSEYLGKLGKYQLYDTSSKPFFQIFVRGKYTLRGSIGNKSIRILLPGDESLGFIDELKEFVCLYQEENE